MPVELKEIPDFTEALGGNHHNGSTPTSPVMRKRKVKSAAHLQRVARATGPAYNPLADPVPSGLPLFAEILRRKVRGQSYYWHPDRLTLYQLRSPKSEDGDEIVEGAYFEPATDWGAPILLRHYMVEGPAEVPAKDRAYYTIVVSGRPDIEPVEVTETELDNGSWTAHFTALAITSSRMRYFWADRVKEQYDLASLHSEKAVNYSGWHARKTADGRTHYIYVRRDGSLVLAPGVPDISIPLVGSRLPEKRAALFEDGIAEAVPDQAALESYRTFGQTVTPHGHLLVADGLALRGLITTIVPSSTALVLEGPEESGKTAIICHARGVDGPSPYRECDGTFDAAAGGFELGLSAAKDAALAIDDFRIPPGATSGEIAKLEKLIDAAVRGSESGSQLRARATRDMKQKTGNSVRSMLLIAGEEMPPVLKSTTRRMVHQKITKGADFDTRLMIAQGFEQQGTLTALGSAILRHVAASLDMDAAEFKKQVRRMEDSYTARLIDYAQERFSIAYESSFDPSKSICANWARVLGGWWLAEQALGLTSGEEGIGGPFTSVVYPFVLRGLVDQLSRQHGVEVDAEGVGPFTRLVQSLAESIASNALVHGQSWQIADANTQQPEPPKLPDDPSPELLVLLEPVTDDTWGFHRDATTGMDQARTPVVAGYANLGREEVYLKPNTIDYLRQLATKMPGCETLGTVDRLWESAKAEGWITRSGEGRNRPVKVGTDGKNGRGWALSLHKWLDTGDTPEPTPDDSLPDSPSPIPFPSPRTDPEPPFPATEIRESRSTGPSGLIGALDDTGLWLSDTGSLPLPAPIRNIGDLAQLAETHNLDQLWIHDTYLASIGLPIRIPRVNGRLSRDASGQVLYRAPHPFFEAPEEWNLDNHDNLFWFIHAFHRGVFRANGHDLVFPSYNEQMGSWPFVDAEDGRELLAAVRYTVAALGNRMLRHGPGSFASQLLRDLHSGRHGLEIVKPNILPPADVLTSALSLDLLWIRDLDAEERTYPWVHGFDKNSQYLGAASSLPLGLGDAHYETLPTFDKRTPGYWHARLSRPVVDSRLPSHWVAIDEPAWYLTPTMELASQLGCVEEISEAWLWKSAARPLEPWYKILRDARTALTENADQYSDAGARSIALAAIKAMYKVAIGHWESTSWDRSKDTLYRPDYSAAIKAQAHANMYRRLLAYSGIGYHPFAQGTDCLYFASPEADPMRAKPPSMQIGTGLRDFKVKDAAVPLPEILPILDYQAGVMTLQRVLNVRRARLEAANG